MTPQLPLVVVIRSVRDELLAAFAPRAHQVGVRSLLTPLLGPDLTAEESRWLTRSVERFDLLFSEVAESRGLAALGTDRAAQEVDLIHRVLHVRFFDTYLASVRSGHQVFISPERADRVALISLQVRSVSGPLPSVARPRLFEDLPPPPAPLSLVGRNLPENLWRQFVGPNGQIVDLPMIATPRVSDRTRFKILQISREASHSGRPTFRIHSFFHVTRREILWTVGERVTPHLEPSRSFALGVHIPKMSLQFMPLDLASMNRNLNQVDSEVLAQIEGAAAGLVDGASFFAKIPDFKRPQRSTYIMTLYQDALFHKKNGRLYLLALIPER